MTSMNVSTMNHVRQSIRRLVGRVKVPNVEVALSILIRSSSHLEKVPWVCASVVPAVSRTEQASTEVAAHHIACRKVSPSSTLLFQIRARQMPATSNDPADIPDETLQPVNERSNPDAWPGILQRLIDPAVQRVTGNSGLTPCSCPEHRKEPRSR